MEAIVEASKAKALLPLWLASVLGGMDYCSNRFTKKWIARPDFILIHFYLPRCV